MSQKDKVEKVLEDYNDVFADIYNTLLFQEPFLEEDKLEFGPTESVYKSEQGELKEQRRDVLKVYRDNNLVLLSLGAENQSKIDKNMLIRVMGYDCATYRRRLSEGKSLAPVITIVLNFTDIRWNVPTSLHELLNVSGKLKPFVSDYQMKVFDIAYLEDEVIEQFSSDFKLVARFFKEKRIGRENDVMRDSTTALRHVEATLDMLKVFANDNRYAEVYTERLKAKIEKGEVIYMCNVAEALEQRGIELGIKEGMKEGMKEGIQESARRMLRKGISCEEVSHMLELDLDTVSRLQKETVQNK